MTELEAGDPVLVPAVVVYPPHSVAPGHPPMVAVTLDDDGCDAMTTYWLPASDCYPHDDQVKIGDPIEVGTVYEFGTVATTRGGMVCVRVAGAEGFWYAPESDSSALHTEHMAILTDYRISYIPGGDQ